MSNSDGSGSIDRDEFLQIPQIQNNPLAGRMIAIFDEEYVTISAFLFVILVLTKSVLRCSLFFFPYPLICVYGQTFIPFWYWYRQKWNACDFGHDNAVVEEQSTSRNLLVVWVRSVVEVAEKKSYDVSHISLFIRLSSLAYYQSKRLIFFCVLSCLQSLRYGPGWVYFKWRVVPRIENDGGK